MKLAGKTAVITGASRSIGAAIAQHYAREGARVCVNYFQHPQHAEQVVADIKAQGGEAFAFHADVSQEDQVERMMEETFKRYGSIDILVNNAAIDPRKTWYEITADEWDRIMEVNVRSQFLCAKHTFPYMKTQNYGKIINVSSVTFFTGQRHFIHYVASKGAIIGFTRALAREVGEYNITVNCITPGAVYTDTEAEKIGQQASAEVLEQVAELQSFSRREVAADLQGAFLFLASADSDFITGQTLNVDGGWIMH